MVNHLLETSHRLPSSALRLSVSVADPSSILRTHFQVPYAATPLFATLLSRAEPRDTKTVGVTSFTPDVFPSARLSSIFRRSSRLCPLFSLFVQRVFHNSFALKCLHTLSKNCRGVGVFFPFWYALRAVEGSTIQEGGDGDRSQGCTGPRGRTIREDQAGPVSQSGVTSE
jgi:hypothetical protein